MLSVPAFSYLPMYTRGQGAAHQDHWDFNAFPVTWNFNGNTGNNITGNRAAVDVIQASFATWQATPNAVINIQRGADSTKTSSGFDGVNLICFVCTGDSFHGSKYARRHYNDHFRCTRTEHRAWRHLDLRWPDPRR